MSLATDPETGESGAREVVATLPYTDQLLTLRTSSGVIVTTEDHRSWNATGTRAGEIVTIEDHPLLESDGSGVAGVPGPRLVISRMRCCPNRCPFGKSGRATNTVAVSPTWSHVP